MCEMEVIHNVHSSAECHLSVIIYVHKVHFLRCLVAGHLKTKVMFLDLVISEICVFIRLRGLQYSGGEGGGGFGWWNLR